MADRRKRNYEDGDNRSKYRKMGEAGDMDVGPDLTGLITSVDKNPSGSVGQAIENLAERLVGQLDAYEEQIISILSDCVAYLPERMTVFSTLAGLMNAKNNQFGDSFIAKMVTDLKTRFNQNEYDIVVRIATFLADLANSHLLTVDSVVQFLFSFLDHASEQNLLSDFYVYCVMHTLPWAGAKIASVQESDLKELLNTVESYLKNRRKHHVKILGVWEEVEPHEQEDYLDSLWAQIQQMQSNNWTEKHISRYYNNFESKFSEAISHNLPSIVLPTFQPEEFKYPLPRVVFRLFAQTDVSDEEPALPGSHDIERFLVEEDLNWIISNNYLNVRLCCKELLNYQKRNTVPLNYVIVEVIFSQLFRLPKPPHLELFYGALLIELFRGESNSMPQVLAQAAEYLYQRSRSLHPVCLDRLVNWFSYHLSNFQYRWSWTEWLDCVNQPKFDRRQVFVREVFEKCMRLAYHEKLAQLLPKDFEPLIPVKPQVVFVLDDPDHPAYKQALTFRNLIKGRADSREILLELKADRLASEEESRYDPDMVAVFTAVLIDISSKTFSHTFAAFTKYVDVFRKVCIGNREMQSTVLRTVFDCWSKHKQMLEMIVDKLMKMRIVEPISVASWTFCEDMKNELHRSWIWGVLNIAIFRLDCHTTNMEQELEDLKKQANRAEKFGESAEIAEISPEEIETKEREVQGLQTEIRDLLLLVCHKFTVCLTELLVDLKDCIDEKRSHELLLEFQFILGRFKHVFLANPEALWKNIDVLNEELFSTADIDPKIVEVYQEFRSLKSS